MDVKTIDTECLRSVLLVHKHVLSDDVYNNTCCTENFHVLVIITDVLLCCQNAAIFSFVACRC